MHFFKVFYKLNTMGIKNKTKKLKNNKQRKLHTSALTLSVMSVNTNGLNADMRRH